MEHKSLEQLNLYGINAVFTIKAKNFESGEVKILKNQTIETYKKSINYLKYLNLNNFNIFISFSTQGGGCGHISTILLDDVKKPVIDRLYKDGLEPFYYLETSSANYQVILKFSDNQLSKETLTFISKQLSEIYNADENSSDIGHFFRLAGFTNRKQKYCKNGLYPFVKFYNGSGKTCTKGQEYIDSLSNKIESIKKESSNNENKISIIDDNKNQNNCFLYIKKIYETNNDFNDLSALDYKVAYYSIKKGFDINDIKIAIKQLSFNIENRKKGHIDDYINRTISNAIK